MQSLLSMSLVFALLASSPIAPPVVLGVATFWAMLGASQAIQALFLIGLIKFLNPSLYQFSGPIALMAWLAIGIAGSRLLMDGITSSVKNYTVIFSLLMFVLVVLTESVFSSYYPVVSTFKILAFAFGSVAILLGFQVTAVRHVSWTEWLLGIWSAVLLLSLPTLLFSEFGFNTNETGFQGILSHPQTLAVFLAPMVAWFSATMFFSRERISRVFYLLAPISVVLLFLTEARTAVLAILLAYLVVGVLGLLWRPDWVRILRRGLTKPITLVCAMSFVVFLMLQPTMLADGVQEFVHKGAENRTIGESFQQSRGRGIASQLVTFKDHPISGIGFGVSLSRDFNPIFDEFTGLPLSASVEKGFLPTAVLEETGILGALSFLIFFLFLCYQVFLYRSLVRMCVFLTCVFINFGEMIFFSIGGLGLYLWLVMGWAASPLWERRLAPH